MSARKHTKGPWVWVRGDGLRSMDGQLIMRHPLIDAGTPDARLIAAAPDLADVLAEYIAEIDRKGLPSRGWADANLAKMRAALRAAGRTP